MCLLERDGVIVLLGLVVTVAASVAAYFLVALLIGALPGITNWFSSIFGVH